MSSILSGPVAFDTNILVYGIQSEPLHPEAERILLTQIQKLRIVVPLQIQTELRRNLSVDELRRLYSILEEAKSLDWDYGVPTSDAIYSWESRGAKKGDAVIIAQLDAAQVRCLITENRHFLREIHDLPFRVLDSRETLLELDAKVSSDDE